MFSRTTRFEILQEAVPEHARAGSAVRYALVGMDQKGVIRTANRQTDGTECPVRISLSHIDTGDVLLDQGGA